MEKTQPNIIFVLTDQQRYDTCGCYGQNLDITPNLDELVNEGIRFEYAFTNQPVCGPARALLQTGRYPTELGCFRNAIGLPISAKKWKYSVVAPKRNEKWDGYLYSKSDVYNEDFLYDIYEKHNFSKKSIGAY
jgi:arylsulfatase A-like enzyme